jgi:CubicO group peptidase (beta-lactamase class C family)
MTVVRNGDVVVSLASGRSLDQRPATGDTPMVVASVSKVVVAMGITRLAEQGRVDVDAPVPWAVLGLDPHPAWGDVTVRELLDHRSGLATARSSWFERPGDCRSHVATLLTGPPSIDRGRWVYSNGNYCLLGLLVESVSLLPLDVALQILVFDPIDLDGIHLTDGGLRPGDVAHPDDVSRLARLGGAGTLVVSTDDLALLFGSVTDADRSILWPPAVFTDQYGYGHTGTITGAKSCIWVLEGGATVVAATIAGDSVSSGGDVCDLVVPAVATDLGLGAGEPVRTP